MHIINNLTRALNLKLQIAKKWNSELEITEKEVH